MRQGNGRRGGRESTKCGKIFTSCTSDRELVSRLYNELKKVNKQTSRNQTKKNFNEAWNLTKSFQKHNTND